MTLLRWRRTKSSGPAGWEGDLSLSKNESVILDLTAETRSGTGGSGDAVRRACGPLRFMTSVWSVRSAASFEFYVQPAAAWKIQHIRPWNSLLLAGNYSQGEC